MAEEEFEIDVYGDAQDGGQEHEHGGAEDYGDNVHMDGGQGHDHDDEQGHADEDTQNGSGDQHNDQSASSTSAPQQGVKRKSEPDDRPVDPGATAALLISELQWWNTEDEVRNWVHEADCEDELKDITFSEHKVNGKSKGYVLSACFIVLNMLKLNFLFPTDKHTSSSPPTRLQPQRSDTSIPFSAATRMAPAIISSAAPRSLTTAPATTHSRPCPRTRRSVLAIMLVAVRLPAPATSTIAEQRTTSRLVEEEEAVAFREAFGADEADSTAAECAVASIPITTTRT